MIIALAIILCRIVVCQNNNAAPAKTGASFWHYRYCVILWIPALSGENDGIAKMQVVIIPPKRIIISMKSAEVNKGEADARFAIKPDDTGKPAESEKPAQGGMALRQFAFWSFWAGAIGLLCGIVADISAEQSLFLSAGASLLLLYGGILWWHTGVYNKTADNVAKQRRIVEGRMARMARDLASQQSDSWQKAANAAKRHKAQLAKAKAEKEQLRTDMQEEMQERDNKAAAEMKARDGAAAAKYKNLESENEKLALTLSGTQETLAYYSDNDELDVYTGEAAVRQCGGIYVISNANEGRVKIGMTADDMSRRLTELRTDAFRAGTPRENIKPEILVPLDEGVYQVEQEIHRALADRRTAGEWFKIPPEEAIAVVLAHVRKKRMHNFKTRSKIRIGKGGGK